MGRLNLAAVLEKNGIDFKHSDGSKEYRVNCPNCGDAKYRLWLNEDKLVGICYKCTEGGSIWKFFKLLGIQQGSEAKKTLTLPKESVVETVTALPPEAKPLWTSKSIMANKAKDYLILKRGLLVEEIEQYKIHYCSRGELAGNIILPIYDIDGKTLLGWQGRRFALSGKKSINPVGSNGRLFNMDKCVGMWGLLIVEGPFDSVICHRKLSEGGIGVVALLGHSLSVNQAGMIAHILKPEKAFVMLDPDAVTDQQRIVLALCREGVNTTLCPKQRADPDELTEIELLEALDQSVKIL